MVITAHRCFVRRWVWHDGYQTATGENPVFQWGGRPGTSCNSAWLGLGENKDRGAGGHWNCDISYPAGPSMEQSNATWIRPRRGVFNHIVLTYTGGVASSATPFIETLFVNGAAVRSYTNRQLAIPRTINMRLGGWNGGGDNFGAFALATLRVHDGCLTSDDVMANYLTEAPSFVPSPSGEGN